MYLLICTCVIRKINEVSAIVNAAWPEKQIYLSQPNFKMRVMNLINGCVKTCSGQLCVVCLYLAQSDYICKERLCESLKQLFRSLFALLLILSTYEVEVCTWPAGSISTTLKLCFYSKLNVPVIAFCTSRSAYVKLHG